MATNLEDKEGETGINQPDPGQAYVDREFAGITKGAKSPQDLREAEEYPDAEGDDEADEDSGDSEGGLYNDGSDESMDGHGLARKGSGKSTGDGDKGGKAGGAGDGDASGGVGSESGGDGEGGLYNDNAKQGRLARGAAKYQKASSGYQNLKKKAGTKKWLVGAGVGGGGAVIALVILLLVFMGAYKAVDFAEHIAAFQFARTAIIANESAASIENETVSIATIADDSAYARLAAKYSTASGKVKDTWAKLDKYRPNKTLENYQADGKLKFNYARTGLGRQYLKSVTVDGVEHTLETPSFTGTLKNKLIPGYKFAKDVNFYRDFAPAMNQSLKGGDIGVITRGRIAIKIQQRIGMGLGGALFAKFLGKTSEPPKAGATPAEAEAAIDSEAQQLSLFEDLGPNKDLAQAPGGNKVIQQAEEEIRKTLEEDAANPAVANNPEQLQLDLEAVLEKNVSGDAAAGMQGAFQSALGKVLGFVNPVYKIAVPTCLIYDGSIVKSGQSMDIQSQQAERTGGLVMTEGAWMKDGKAVNARAAGATNWKLGDITQTYAERRAAGQQVSTADYASTEASALGQRSASIGDLLPGPLGTAVNAIGPACPYVTNIWGAVGLGAINIAFNAITLGGATAVEGGTEAGAEVAIEEALPPLISRIMARVFDAGGKVKQFGIDTAKFAGVIGGLTLLARYYVATYSGINHNPLAVGAEYGDTADCGTNIYAQQVNQEQYYGAPMTDEALRPDYADIQTAMAQHESQKSTFDRYFALSNANSLTSRVGLMAGGYLNHGSFATVFRQGSAMLNPVQSIGSLTPHFFGRASAADPVGSVNTYCGNVQFGYTVQERNLMKQCPADTHDPKLCSFQMLENQDALDQSGLEDAINSHYGKCFDGSETIGNMLASGDIQRSQDGTVLPDKGLCSPNNLGVNNRDPDSPCGSGGCGILVFRYRLAHAYANQMDQMLSTQDVSDGTST